ncbi:T9SS type A sorting domain-containing protein [bacterium]|nr:T9SS type A sorting domain-containing protein [bacterium]
MSGSYPGGSNTRFVSPAITITAQQGQYPELYFWHWFRIAESHYYGNDKGFVQISVNGGDWSTIGGPYSGISTVWSQSYVDLCDYIDSTVNIAFYLTSGTLVDDVGWYVDDIRIEGIVTDAPDRNNVNIPSNLDISQNYPNPFNPLTNISYNLPRKSDVTIEIFNILGQKIITLANETKPAGEYQITWDGNDSNGNKASTGIYFYRFRAGDFIETKKMMLLK